VDVFTTICPHEGCSVNYLPAAGQFKCPCHTGTFTITGAYVSGPPKRGMDTLDWKLDPDDPDVILVKYEKFITDRADKVAQT
jgi:Rieske Fe-S protein